MIGTARCFLHTCCLTLTWSYLREDVDGFDEEDFAHPLMRAEQAVLLASFKTAQKEAGCDHTLEEMNEAIEELLKEPSR
jgi:hypothetical protein